MKHFGWWVGLAILLYVVAFYLMAQAFGSEVATRAWWLASVLGAFATLFLTERRRGARPSMASLLGTACAAGSLAWTFAWLDASWYVKVLVLMVLVMPLMSLANAAYRGDVRRAQRRRDEQAASVVHRVMHGETEVGPFVLYLRPFASTDRLPAEALPPSFSTTNLPVHLDVETLLARALRDDCPFIAMGRSGEVEEGAGRVSIPDDRWQDVVQALAHRATFLAMVPLAHPSTTWELRWLIEQHLLGKVLLIMPETLHEAPSGVVYYTEKSDRIFDAGIREFDAAQHVLDLPREWADAVRVAREIGLELPPLAPVGALFTIDPETRRVNRIAPLALSHLARPANYLRAAIVHLQLYRFSRPQPRDLLTAFRAAVFYRGTTLEYALVRAADGFLLWGDFAQAMTLLRQAHEGRRNPKVIKGYVSAFPLLVQQWLTLGDRTAAERYREGTRLFLADPVLAPFVNPELPGEIDELIKAGAVTGA